MPTRVLLIEDNRIEARQTQHWLKSDKDAPFEVETLDQLQTGLQRLATGDIEIVLLDLNLPDSRGLETFVNLHEKYPDVPVVVLTGEYDETIGQFAVEKGAQDFLVKQQIDGPALIRVVRHALARHHALHGAGAAAPKRTRSARILGFIGAKGGVGTTTTALNIAQALCLKHHSTILVEPRPSFGTLSLHLHHRPPGNLLSLLESPPERIGTPELEATLCQGEEGLRILYGAQEKTDPREIDPRHIEAVLRTAAGMAEFVILDLPNHLTSAVQIAVRMCHHVVVVTEREPISVAAAKQTCDQLAAWGVGGNLVGAIVVNRTIYPISMSFQELQSKLGCGIYGMIPSAAPNLLAATTRGTPLVIADPQNDAAFTFQEIAGKIAADKLAAIVV